VLADSSRGAIEHTKLILNIFLLKSGSLGTSEEIAVFLVGEVNIVVAVSVRVPSGVITIVLPEGVGSKVSGLTVFPSLKLKVRHTAVSVEVAHRHGTLVGVVVNHFSAEEPLLFFAETLKNVIRADLHDGNFLSEALVLGYISNTILIVADFFIATAGDLCGPQSHVLRVLHGGGAETARLVTEGFVLTIGVPIIVGLVVSVPLLERVVKIAVKPVELGHNTKVEGHLSVLIRLEVVSLADGVSILYMSECTIWLPKL